MNSPKVSLYPAKLELGALIPVITPSPPLPFSHIWGAGSTAASAKGGTEPNPNKAPPCQFW